MKLKPPCDQTKTTPCERGFFPQMNKWNLREKIKKKKQIKHKVHSVHSLEALWIEYN